MATLNLVRLDDGRYALRGSWSAGFFLLGACGGEGTSLFGGAEWRTVETAGTATFDADDSGTFHQARSELSGNLRSYLSEKIQHERESRDMGPEEDDLIQIIPCTDDDWKGLDGQPGMDGDISISVIALKTEGFGAFYPTLGDAANDLEQYFTAD